METSQVETAQPKVMDATRANAMLNELETQRGVLGFRAVQLAAELAAREEEIRVLTERIAVLEAQAAKVAPDC